MVVRALLTSALVFACLASAGAVETAAHGAHLARCVGVLEETLAGGAAPEHEDDLQALVARAREAAVHLDLADAEVARTVERGRATARRVVAEGQEERLGGLLTGCGVIVRTGVR